MLKPYFCDNDKWFELREEMESWIGTPYRHYQRAKGYGADCTMFIAACYLKIGLLKEISYDYYSRDWHTHTDNPIVENNISYNFNKFAKDGVVFKKIFLTSGDFVRGDLVLFWTSKPSLSNHCSILFEDGRKMIHSINHVGVEFTEYFKWWKRHTRYVLRAYQEVF